MSNVADAVDRFQRRHPVVSFPLGVIYKFFDDQGNYLAATLTYYAFIAIFPLLLLASTILGFVLQGNVKLQESILDSALSQFPIIGDQLGRPEGLTGSTTAVIFGTLVALYGALGLGQAIQNSMNVAWAVPRNSRPNPFLLRLKSLLVLMTAGLAILAVTAVSIIGSNTQVFSDRIDTTLAWVINIVTVLVVGTVFTFLFRLASSTDHSVVRAAPGAFTLAIMWQFLQYGGAWYVDRVLVNTSSMTKTFGLVLGLIGFIYIASVMAVLGIEINVVLAERLYPRALLTPFTDAVDLTEADRRAYVGYARAQRHKGFEHVEVTFGERARPPNKQEASMSTEPFWITAFLDLPAKDYTGEVAFWSRITSYDLSPARGDDDEFGTLLPPDGDEFLKVQRLGAGPPRIHLDVHVQDPGAAGDRAVELGATVVERSKHGYVVLTSPAGLTFCFVSAAASQRPKPTVWPDGHRSLLDQVCVDVPRDGYEDEFRFWAELTGWQERRSSVSEDFRSLQRPEGIPIRLLFQRLEEQDGTAGAHLDFASSDRPAETRRHLGLGAELVREWPAWTVLRTPAGSAYCLTDRDPDTGLPG